MDRIDDEPVWLRGPDSGDLTFGRQAAEHLQSAGEVVGQDKDGKMRSKLANMVVMLP